jgi:glucose-1-phosphate cytidylyltransferase
MEVVILAGGKGERLREFTKKIPKPCIKLYKYNLLEKLILYYSYYGCDKFIICGGYKFHILKKSIRKSILLKRNIKFINTGLNTGTASRLKKIEKYIKNDNFYLTYGDALSNLNLNKLYKFHQKNKSHLTFTAVPFVPDKGVLDFHKEKVKNFYEKKSIDGLWINAGFMVLNKIVIKKINKNNTCLETNIFNYFLSKKKLFAFKYFGYWKCLDNYKDYLILKKKDKKNYTSS